MADTDQNYKKEEGYRHLEGSNQNITGYIQISEKNENILMSDVDRKVLRLQKITDQVVVDLTLRDRKQHYFYDNKNTKFFMDKPCRFDCDRTIDRPCGQDIFAPEFTIGTTINVSSSGGGGGGGGGRPCVGVDCFPSPPCASDDCLPPLPCLGLDCFPTECPPGREPNEYGECVQPPEDDEDRCPIVSRYGVNADRCEEACCVCGNVAHCVLVSSFSSGFVVRQCAPASGWTPPFGCSNDTDCHCPTCGECEDCGGVGPNDPCYCKCARPRQELDIEFQVCDVKTVECCWYPGNGLEADGTMKFSSQDGTTAFLDFEKGIFKPGHLGEGLVNDQDIETEDPLAPGHFDRCPQDTYQQFAPCVLACGYGDELEGYVCEPNDRLYPEIVNEGCSRGTSTYYQYNCYGVMTCPQGTHQTACTRVPRLVFSWYPILIHRTDDGVGFGDGELGFGVGRDFDSLPRGGPDHANASGCETRALHYSCDELNGDGALPEEYQTNWGGTLYPPAG